MLTLPEIDKYYPEDLRRYPRFILREYLQHKILQIIFDSEHASTQIFITPSALLLARKFYAILNRGRNKGRDFYDVVFLPSITESPNYDYLLLKTGIRNAKELKERILDKCERLDMKEMAKDVQPFLFDSADAKKVALFADYIKQVKLI